MAVPVLFHGGAPHALTRLQVADRGGGAYDERWLQTLIQTCPEVLPTQEIEPLFGRLIPAAMEVPCGHGAIDNLFVTPNGGIALVETKLWRNPEARRSVVAQALDYAAAIARMDYGQFEAAVLAGLPNPGAGRPRALYDLLAEEPEALEEPRFIDAVAHNLKTGRFLVIAAGDGIRAETETLAGLLQSHAGARFTFALVSLELFRTATDQILAVPRTLARTVLIERGVVRIVDPRIEIESAPAATATAPRTSMTEELFMEALAARSPALPGHLRAFLTRLTSLGVEPEWRASLNLKWYGENLAVNLGYIRKEGFLSTDATSYTARSARDAAVRYQQRLADLVGGRVVQRSEVNGPYLTTRDGRSNVRLEALLPEHAEAWEAAVAEFIEALQQAPAIADAD
ncbi:hypothetical protein [Phenylobacterium zucineum]|nr:hypothetical protein [Phenylobacterium zucineum]